MATKTADPQAEVTRRGALDMQVCVPESWSFKKIKEYADAANPCGTSGGWQVRKEQRLLCGDPVRQPCAKREGCVHVMLDA